MSDRATQQLGDVSLDQLAALASGLGGQVGQHRGDLLDLVSDIEQRAAGQSETVVPRPPTRAAWLTWSAPPADASDDRSRC
ncbi:hypothetical protein [Streptosporangium roseum]|uniref:hypothetical protein n=1 Tax=Streptosporangium roseum TaxID=2001 RepID=UPI003429C002